MAFQNSQRADGVQLIRQRLHRAAGLNGNSHRRALAPLINETILAFASCDRNRHAAIRWRDHFADEQAIAFENQRHLSVVLVS